MDVLKMNGYTCDTAENGKVGVELFNTNEYDTILMDIQMPIMTGIDATIEIREVEEKKWVGEN